MPQTATLALHPRFAIDRADPRLFGGFIEHLGRAVYEGIWQPGHPEAGPDGIRRDVLALIRELDMPVTRYPGGNFVSGYDWEDGIGPRADRPTRLDLAWQTVETNAFGTDEFLAWCAQAGTEPMLAVNLGTRGPDAARRLAEYCNFPGGTALSDLRRRNGRSEPWGVKLWCLGNEMDGRWQMGHTSAARYGELAGDAARMLKALDPANQVVVCGSSNHTMSSFGAWELEMLDRCYDDVDLLSLHQYVRPNGLEPARFLGLCDVMSRYIEQTAALCDAIGAKRKSRKRLMLSFDEWNVWYMDWARDRDVPRWTAARPILEDTYTALDAIMVGGMLITLLSHADRVKVGCIAQSVNVIGPIRTEHGPAGRAWRQSIFHPFAVTSRYGLGTVLRSPATCGMVPAAPVPAGGVGAGDAAPVAALQQVAVLGDDGTLTVFAINRDPCQPLAMEAELIAGRVSGPVEHRAIVAGDDPRRTNGPDRDVCAPQPAPGAAVADGRLRALLPPLSWNILRVPGAW